MSPVAIASVLVIAVLCSVAIVALFAWAKDVDRQAEEVLKKRR